MEDVREGYEFGSREGPRVYDDGDALPQRAGVGELSQWDVLGMEWNARPEAWSALKAAKRPMIAHIITSPGQAKRALAAGVTGLMVSSPSKVHP